MNWIIASLLMSTSSVGLYLLVRKSNTSNTPLQLNNLAMFLIPVFIYLALITKNPTILTLTPLQYLLIFIQAIFFSYLGNVFSLRGIQYSPNPGYSLIISKSYVIFTSVASIFLFSAPLTLRSVLAIFIIIIFSALITLNPNNMKTNTNKLWLPYTVGAFFCWGFLALSSKYLLIMGVPILARLIVQMVVVTILILAEIIIKKIKVFSINREQYITLLFIGLFGASYAYFMQVGFNLAPNVGYVNAANAGSISLLTLMSTIIFKDELTIKKMIGIIGVTTGLIVLFL